MRVLAIDVGTTTVKAAVVEGSALRCSATVATDAYRSEAVAKAQDAGAIFRALSAALSALDLTGVRRVALCGQMHGVLAYSSATPLKRSDLITWEDCSCAPRSLLAACNTALYSAPRQLPPVHAGYGCVTLLSSAAAWAADGYDRCTTIAAYVAGALTGRLTAPVVDPTEAASLGFFDAQSGEFAGDVVDAVATKLPLPAPRPSSFLPAIVPSGSVLGRLDGAAASFFGLAPLEALHGVEVMVPVGDHPASVLGVLSRDRHSRDSSGQTVRTHASTATVIINIGTSAQAAVVGSALASLPHTVGAGGLEWRPFLPHNGTASASPFLVAASLNGGNVLASVARVEVKILAERTRSEAPLDAAYTALESAADAAAAQSSLHRQPQHRLDVPMRSILLPERRAVGWGPDAAAHNDAAAPHQDAVDAVTAAIGAIFRSADMSEADAHRGGVYTAIVGGVLDNLLDMLPPAVWGPAEGGSEGESRRLRVVAAGGAVAKSRTVWRCLVEAIRRRAPGAEVVQMPLADTEFASCFGLAALCRYLSLQQNQVGARRSGNVYETAPHVDITGVAARTECTVSRPW